MDLDVLLENRLGHLPMFQKLHIYSISTSGVEIELIFTLWAAVSQIYADFQNCHIWAWNFVIGQNARSRIYTLSTPRGQFWTYFRSTGSSFWDTGRFSKLPYLGMRLGHWPKSQKLHIYPRSTPRGRNWAYFCSTGRGLRDKGRFSTLPYLGMKFGHWPKCQKLHIYTLFTPGGRNAAYFRSRGSGFRDMGRFSKLPYLGMKIGHWSKCHKFHIYPLSARSCTYTLFLPKRFEIELIFVLRAAVY